MSNKLFFLVIAFTCLLTKARSQTVVITDDNTYVTGQASSVLDIKSVTKGFLAPRMTLVQRVAISSPAEGLLVYQTDNVKGFYYYSSSAWVPIGAGSGTGWSLTGNAGTTRATNFLGTTDAISFPFRTNNIQRMLLDSLGNVGIGTAPAFSASPSAEKFLVDAGTTTSVNAIVGRGSINNYLQLNIQNLSNGTSASSDVVATADNGTETTNFVDMGINSSTNTSGVMGNANDAYLYNIGQNFLIGTGAAAKSLIFMTGGTTQSTNERMRIDGTGKVGIGTTTPSSALHVVGTNPLTLTGVQNGSSSDSILTIINGVVRKLLPSSLVVSSTNAWALVGNSGTNPASNFLGTIDAQPLLIKTNNVQVGRFDQNSFALGQGSTINTATNSFAFGFGANVGFSRLACLAIGNSAAVSSDSSLSIGIGASTTGTNSFSIGNGANSNSTSSFALGRSAYTGYNKTAAMAMGNGATVNSDSSFAIGVGAVTNGTNSFAIGLGAASNSATSMAVGRNAVVGYSIADAMAVGENATANAANSIAIGSNNSTGSKTQTNGAGAIALGNTAVANSPNSLALGSGATVAYSLATPGMAIGTGTTVSGNNSIAFGNGAVTTFVANATALGGNTAVSGANSTAIGYNTAATKANEIILGDITNTGLSVGIGSEAFNATNREKFLVDAGTTSSVNAILGRGTINNYLQLNIQNLSNGVNASSDVVATADNGTETTNFVDMGINSSTNTSGVMGNFDDAYLYNIGQNFLIGTGAASKALIFMTGGTTQSTNERMRIDGTGKVGIGTATPATALHVVGTNPLTLNGVQVGATSDSILTIASGTVRKLAFSTLTTGASWALTGNAGTTRATNFLGTTDAISFPFRTNNIQRMLIDSLGNVGIGTAPAFSASPSVEKFLVDAGTTTSVNAIVGRGNINNYLQLNIQNQSNGTSASSDVVATADNGSETTNFVDMGINSSTNTQGIMGAANDAYLYSTGNNFLIGNGTAAKSLVFMTGGTTQSSNEHMRIDGFGNVGIGVNNPTNPLTLKDTMEIRRTGVMSELLFSNTAGTGNFRIGGDGGDIYWQGGGGQNLQMDAYWGIILGGDRQTPTAPAFSTGVANTGVLVLAQRDVSVPLGIQANSATQSANLTEWRSSSATLDVVDKNGKVGIGTTGPATALHVMGTNPLTLSGVQVGATSDSILTIASGTVRKLAFSTLTTGASWALTGNAGTTRATNFLGTTDAISLPFRTNNIQRMLIDSLGNVGIGTAPAFTASPGTEKLLVDAGTTTSFNAIVAKGTINNYFQLNVQNLSNGLSASSDVVATADNGNELINYIDMGINSSTNTQAVMGAANDAYLYTTGNNFLIGTGTAAKSLVFMTGGTTQSTNEHMRIDGNGNVGIGKAAPAFTLDVKGRGNYDSTVSAPNYTSTVQALTSGTVSWDQQKGATATVTLTGNSTLTITNAVASMYGLIKVKQDATGSRTLTLPAGSKVINGGGGVVALTTTANAVDVLSYFYDGTNYFWTIGYNYN